MCTSDCGARKLYVYIRVTYSFVPKQPPVNNNPITFFTHFFYPTHMFFRFCQPNVVTYNTAITACTAGGQEQKASVLMDLMRQDGVAPDIITYNSMITACAAGGRHGKAVDLLREMRADGITPDIISYNSTITACAHGGQWKQALSIFERMQTAGGYQPKGYPAGNSPATVEEGAGRYESNYPERCSPEVKGGR